MSPNQKPSEKKEAIEFSQSVEGLFIKGLSSHLTPDIRAQLRAAGLDLDKPLRPGYPAGEFHRWIEITARGLHPELPLAEGTRLVGRYAISGLEEGIIGKAMAAGLKLIGPKRALQRVDRIFKSNNNYQDASLMELSESGARVSLSNVFGLPWYYQGIFESAVAAIGAKHPKVEVAASPPPGAVLNITWS